MNIARIATGSLAAALLGGAALPAMAGGIERSTQSMNILFEPGRLVELSFGQVSPSISGLDNYPLRQPTGDVADSYLNLGLAYKQDFGDNFSAALILDQPNGADIAYDLPAAGGSPMLGGTMTEVNSTALTGVVRYHNDSGFGVHAGLRYDRANAKVSLRGLAYGPFNGYDFSTDTAGAMGWLAGVSWERPEIAARVALTYNSEIEHEFDIRESSASVPLLNGRSSIEVTTPRSWNLEFQTGVAPDTLVFGSVRWVKWSEFQVKPTQFVQLEQIATGRQAGLVELSDTTTWTLGVGRKFTERWSGSASVSYEKQGDGLVSPLAGWEGRTGVTLAAIYTLDNMKITGGVNYTRLGDADQRPNITPGTGVETPAAVMEDNDSVSFGVRVAVGF